jgi:hypothetical protein
MSKEKSKLHPFAGYLHETEEVLWMREQNDTSIWVALRKSLPILGLTPIVMVGLFFYSHVANIIFTTGFKVSNTFYLIIAASMIGTFFIMFWQNVKEGRSERVYAVTNERLLYRQQQTVTAWPLENVISVSVITDGQNSLSFGPLYPIWHNVENAAAVKQIIEEAKAQRMQGISA